MLWLSQSFLLHKSTIFIEISEVHHFRPFIQQSTFLLYFDTRAYLLLPDKGRVMFFLPKIIVANFLYLEVLFYEVNMNHLSETPVCSCVVSHIKFV